MCVVPRWAVVFCTLLGHDATSAPDRLRLPSLRDPAVILLFVPQLAAITVYFFVTGVLQTHQLRDTHVFDYGFFEADLPFGPQQHHSWVLTCHAACGIAGVLLVSYQIISTAVGGCSKYHVISVIIFLQ